eukprot:CAMPEP_0203748110 /NCGR_PEP_ID=MMETSP0098-20131031/3069_1 /ASSEMBLY_ACC=CAM_ASM_000208 /TAXON_ID=96639 /ORGANISM=" , Strain NY0313808BC1" /LENGTH=1255 /DNA_ID=CAMNT_0050636733 /DNA_START=818 /DNA_END=4582 /DNA_ORIENTATION=-
MRIYTFKFESYCCFSSSAKLTIFHSAHVLDLESISVENDVFIKIVDKRGKPHFFQTHNVKLIVDGLFRALSLCTAGIPPQIGVGPLLYCPPTFVFDAVTITPEDMNGDPFFFLFQTYLNLFVGLNMKHKVMKAICDRRGVVGRSVVLEPYGSAAGGDSIQKAIVKALAMAGRFSYQIHEVCINGLNNTHMDESVAMCIGELFQFNVNAMYLSLRDLQIEQQIWVVFSNSLNANPRPLFGANLALTNCNLTATVMPNFAIALQRLYVYSLPVSLEIRPSAMVSAAELLGVLRGEYLTAVYPEPKVCLPLPNARRLQRLVLENFDLGANVSYVDDLVQVLGECSVLEEFGLVSCNLHNLGESIIPLFSALGTGPSPLTFIDVSSNTDILVSQSVCTAFGACIGNKLPSIKMVVLNNINLQPSALVWLCEQLDGFEEQLSILIKEFRRAKRLLPPQELDSLVLQVNAGYNKMDNFEPVAAPMNLSLQSCGMSGWRILKSVVESFTFAESREYRLDLSNNNSAEKSPLSADEYGNIVQWLGRSPPVWSLLLANCALGQQARWLFEHGLTKNTSLVRLDITSNKVGNVGFEMLGQALRKNRTLQYLDYDDNDVTLVGWKAIRGALYGNKKIIHIGRPEIDLARLVKAMIEKVKGGEIDVNVARRAIKVACRNRNYAKKRRKIEDIREAKRRIRNAEKEKKKSIEVVTAIEQVVQSNKGVLAVKQLAKQDVYASKNREKFVKKQVNKRTKALVKMKKVVNKVKGKRVKVEHKRRKQYQKERKRQARSSASSPTYDPYMYDPGLYDPWYAYDYRHFHHHTYQDPYSGQPMYEDHGETRPYSGTTVPGCSLDPLIQMELLINSPDFFLPANIALFELYANMAGPEVSAALEQELRVAYETNADVQEQGMLFGDPSLDVEMLEDESIALALVEFDEQNPADDMTMFDDMGDDIDVVDMYGAAGPHDYPPDNQSHGWNATAVRACRPIRSQDRFKDVAVAEEFEDWIAKLNRMWDDALEGYVAPTVDEILVEEILHTKGDSLWRPVDNYNMKRIVSNIPEYGSEDDCVLCTQCSIDRLGNLKRLMQTWGGPMSIAVYIESEEEERVVSLFCQEIDLGSRYLALVAVKATSEWYPINLLRNCAILEAAKWEQTQRVFLLDVDFAVSPFLHEYLGRTPFHEPGVAFVVPAFEAKEATVAFDVLTKLYKQGCAEGFHVSHFPMGHEATDFERWFQATEVYQVEYQENFEPYVIMRLEDVLLTLYDERW